MKIFKNKHKLQKTILSQKNLSFVPTMGGLHKGHISLIKVTQQTQVTHLDFQQMTLKVLMDQVLSILQVLLR